MVKPTDFAVILTSYFSSYLPGQCNVSSNTIKSYRDTFTLFLGYCNDVHSLPPEKLKVELITRKLVEDFLSWLEVARDNSISTRNQRLAAIHAFFRFVQYERPESLMFCQNILAIRFKKFATPQVMHIQESEMRLLLAQPDTSTPKGRRDLTVLSLLYDSGARVQEIIDLKVRDIRLDEPATISLLGKGRKVRHVPLMRRTRELLQNYLEENNLLSIEKKDHPLFFNSQRTKLTRVGISYIIDKYVVQAKAEDSNFPESVSPHVFRHTKAMHLLISGVNLFYIKDLLGHSDVSTTEIYARADTEMKRKALLNAYCDVLPQKTETWTNNPNLMSWLQNLCR